MMKKIVYGILCVSVCPFTFGQPPSRLTTDLLEHTDRVFLDGYPSNLTLSELGTAIERHQTAAIRSEAPSLGWVVNSDRPNTLQTAYRILVASSLDLLNQNEADMWDSGRTESDESVAVCYKGRPLQAATKYHWKVKIWDNHGTETQWSSPRDFITADRLDGATARYPLQISDEHPALLKSPSAAHYFIDFGKAAFGQLKLTLTATEADTLTVHLGEALKDGRINRTPPGSVRYAAYRLPLTAGTHTYIVKIRPDKRNTNVQGGAILMPDYIGEVFPFRYCEIENCRTELAATQVVRRSVHYPFNDVAASFHSSDTVLNQVWELCKYSVKATSFLGISVDGDRERIPYEGDIIVGQLCHYTANREYTFVRHSHEYLIKHPTWPTEWILQSVLLAWADYLYTGNSASLQRCYDDLQAKTLSALRESNGLISTKTEKLTPEVLDAIHRGKPIRDIVDWPQKGILGLGKNEGGEADGFVFSTYNTVVNAYHYETLRLLSLIAETLGKTADATKYAAEAQQVKTQINRLLLDTGKGYYIDGIDADHSSLHANMFPLAFGIVPQKYRKKTLDFIRSRGMACSVYGAQFLLDALYDNHAADYALQLLASTAERSWYNMIREGATISMEAWDQKYKPNQDWNHIWGAAAGNIIPRKLMGVEPLEPGFRRIRIKPQPSTLRHAEMRMPTIRGDIGVSFDNQPDKKFEMEIEIPANATAEVWLPRLSAKSRLTVDGVEHKGDTAGRFIKVEVGSGKHRFLVL
ncbi:MAG: family 78 glycoside hydrolase catalytic domain [Tannerella sp.]|nr:family 78 glycoside hydrolase catalytic domain [Tannerella sp.]